MYAGDPTDTSIKLRPLEPASGQALARDLVLKTRRRKGLGDQIAVSKYLDDEFIVRVAFLVAQWGANYDIIAARAVRVRPCGSARVEYRCVCRVCYGIAFCCVWLRLRCCGMAGRRRERRSVGPSNALERGAGAWGEGATWHAWAGNSRGPVIRGRLCLYASKHLVPSRLPRSFPLHPVPAFPRPGPSYTMRSVALSALLAVAVSSASASEDVSPFKVCVPRTLIYARVRTESYVCLDFLSPPLSKPPSLNSSRTTG